MKKGERYIWFRYAFEEDKVVATKPEMHELIEQYLSRHDDEIAELEQDRNKGHRKPKAPRQDQLEALKISECNEYISGLGKLLENGLAASHKELNYFYKNYLT